MHLSARAIGGFLGNLHPALVHFPIALLTMAALLEASQIVRKRPGPSPATLPLVFSSAAGAVFSSFLGFLLQGYEGEEGGLLELHRWFGLGATAAALGAAGLLAIGRTNPLAISGGRAGLVAGSALVLGTGFLGGELVFGQNHLFAVFEAKPAVAQDAARTPTGAEGDGGQHRPPKDRERSAEAAFVGAGPVREERVRISDFKFDPPSLTVAPGTKVTWLNKDDEPHTATSSEKPKRFDSAVLDTEQSFSFTFSEPGSYPYFCKLHPHMTGVIVVR